MILLDALYIQTEKCYSLISFVTNTLHRVKYVLLLPLRIMDRYCDVRVVRITGSCEESCANAFHVLHSAHSINNLFREIFVFLAVLKV